ncbi:ABC transporter ATP-binding protein [Gilvimarinus sp. SDUM040013]|uniref:ABC transporter ATP-binding protein n=1 Tax=Gilvimarinus gilvus TaxID=3058038 RepID=A0ABU4RTZ4_9GAMM|nr:ABC transporter ATP-binding protein [Gilvimarinus sp. SDUM040013]MDO3386725.1 ABC transporter ATP-binding protein [Gilvimarinus sp. SDUM040013]MDX6848345.1 ABC transporter ATP-binding protein [Gilvimarinus sp. SDUM040013]
MIKINKLWKEYGDNVVLEDISKTVADGEFVTLVGTSGCGKSTFLKMLLGMETASRGELLIDDKPIPGEPDQSRGIVFQQYSVFPHLSVLENVMIAREFERSALLGKLFGVAKRKVREEAQALLEKVGLGPAVSKYPHELSGGMRQRLAIAQALIRKPRVLLLDEPFGALDPGIRADMHKLILELWREHQLTVFMVTHDLSEGFYLGTRLWVFDKVRHDPQAPGAWGAKITYDLTVGEIPSDTLAKVQKITSPEEQQEVGELT